MFIKSLKFICWMLAWPFLTLWLLMELKSCSVAGRRYRKDKTTSTVEERYEKVRKLLSHVLYWKRVHIEAINNERIPNKPMLFIANHKSNIDPLIILHTVLKQNVPYLTFVAKKELDNTFFGQILDLLDVIYIDRSSLRQVPEIIQKSSELIRDKRSVCVFLEGTRILEKDKLGEFHSPLLEIAYNTHASIQPLVLSNTIGLLDKNIKPESHNVKIQFLSSLSSSTFVNIDRQSLSNKLHRLMSDAYHKIEN